VTQVGLIDEKNQRSKISCYCPFKLKPFFGYRIYPKERTDFGIKLHILDLHEIMPNI
jgi:hypothetical protein